MLKRNGYNGDKIGLALSWDAAKETNCLVMDRIMLQLQNFLKKDVNRQAT